MEYLARQARLLYFDMLKDKLATRQRLMGIGDPVYYNKCNLDSYIRAHICMTIHAVTR